ncbi:MULTISPECIES: acetyl-CoA C-acetyltransferase [Desulfococcus]|uniref:Acetyl-CoA acetyltransferase n=1 Tax=Desulfococcus multivorans DSM 2059 TaxID=1121405 RepID=S7TPX4_DESML|nr:acetyl-CoA C-acetyltransferase [Desulfococcus multivorans]AOY57929.1 AtoB2: acetyl-CoA acetyltransferase (acetoacetyl-CoA thiolase) [Desulfococcus multivorans]AQV00301.1 acetyl-CoA acetyltransferase [Desulfococcus multivorans]EPR39011.1 acetyl-CoA acetyltransferase [Desulfococcus multivorans DSM 2059]SJZ65155.1 acetyl-CoA acetyltransferase [Desulfococcus multivorans DSM 2059]
MREAVIVSAVRTPLGAFNGALGNIGATDLGGMVIAEAVKRAGIAKEAVDEVLMGQVLPCGYGQNPAKQAAVKAGLPWEAECITVNKVCGSALKTVMLAAQAVQVGDADIVVAGGMENMSLAPYYLEKARFGYRMGPGKLQDSMIHDGLWDIVNDFHMGMSNELCSEKYGVTREDQDRYAAESYRRAVAAISSGRFKDEILPVEIPQRKGAPKIFDQDECARETSYEALSRMSGAFKKGGLGTAGNASIISDGAAAVVVMAREKAETLGCRVLATIGAQASYGIDMKYVLVAPIWAIPKCLAKEGISMDEVDLFEINEAFSGSSVAILKELKIDAAKVNVNGGAVALGHPIGASGCRVLVTLLYEMARQDKKIGLASLCLGGGEAVAMIVKR